VVKRLIYETVNFQVLAHDKPHVTRKDGGHIIILPNVRVKDRTFLSPPLATELMKLTMMVGEAMATALNRRGIDIGRINYQDNGNWGVSRPEGPHLHVHLYGRAKSATTQKYGEALYLPRRQTGFYDHFEPLSDGDIAEIRDEIERLSLTPKYQSF
jgi:diadenosine tetraphosphate (Ap4A) HIT family hydrolase